jgi:tight adherence protein B
VSRRILILAALGAFLALAPAAALGAGPGIIEGGNANFPDRAFVLTLPKPAHLTPANVVVSENGQPVDDLTVTPAEQAQKGKFGVVLVLDTSASMLGRPIEGARAALHAFASRRTPTESIGLVTFNRSVDTVLEPTTDSAAIDKAIAAKPKLAVGTRINDAIASAIALLQKARIVAGSIVLLSDGRDTRSKLRMKNVIAQAEVSGVRVFTVGLRSEQFRPGVLKRLADKTGALYAQAQSPDALTPIYTGLAARLSKEYLLQYKSLAGPAIVVNVHVQVNGVPGFAASAYQTPSLPPRFLPPFHRSFWDRFWLSSWSIAVVVLLAGLLAALAVWGLVHGGKFPIRERMGQFVTMTRVQTPGANAHLLGAIDRALAKKNWWQKFKSEIEISEFRFSGPQIVLMTVASMVVLVFILAIALPPLFVIFGFLVPPYVARWLVKRKLKAKRDAFAEQLPDNLNVLASALRVGHSFIGALSVMVDEADEPAKSEFRRAIADEQLGIPVEDALVTVAERMDSRDLEQVALVAALQRQTGGNTAEVLDTVVETIRERQDIRRLVQTLTAQGRAARWILTGLPVFLFLAIVLIDRGYLHPLFHRTAGQALLVIAILMICAGSLVIKRIIEIKV